VVHYVLIQGPSYRELAFEAREQVREKLRENLEGHGVRFLQYDWVWDEEDRCLLLVGQYEKAEDARYWIDALESMGFTVLIRTQLPGDETERTTRAGIKIMLRPVRSDDKELLRFFAESLSEEDLYFRFFRHVVPTEDLLTRLVDIDPTKQIAILALVGSGESEKIVGVGRCFIDRERATAEVAITVGDEYQNKGIGRELLLHLISLARARGLKGLTAQVLVDNAAIMRLLRSLDGIEYDIQRRVEEGVFLLDMIFK
jgi:ribosomal protein S18 acetylase RimI-like enzyme